MSKRSHEDCLIDLKKALDALGLDRNDPESFIRCSNSTREQATNLIFSYLEVFNDDAIVSMYKDHLQLDSHDNRNNSVVTTQSSILKFFGKRPKVSQSSIPITTKASDRASDGVSPNVINSVRVEPDVQNPVQPQSVPRPDPRHATTALNDLPRDPAIRIPIREHGVSQQVIIDRYSVLGPCQPRLSDYPCSTNGKRFNSKWFDRFSWLEYSISDNSAFCFPCYLVYTCVTKSTRRGSFGAFITEGFRSWKHALESNKGLVKHHNSADHTHAVLVMESRKAKILPQMLSKLDESQKAAQALQVKLSTELNFHY